MQLRVVQQGYLANAEFFVASNAFFMNRFRRQLKGWLLLFLLSNQSLAVELRAIPLELSCTASSLAGKSTTSLWLQAHSSEQKQLGHWLGNVALAQTAQERNLGLMHRNQWGHLDAMLFVFEPIGSYCMWMKNTALPLSVAFFNDRCQLLSIHDMTPYSEQLHCNQSGQVRYALEVPQGWFQSHGIAQPASMGWVLP